MQLHIGIGAGTITFLHIGGAEQKMEFLFTGDPLRQAVECEEKAKPGEVYLSKEAFHYCKEDLKVKGRKVRMQIFAISLRHFLVTFCEAIRY
jgi:class 3 adenylate cyclase